MFTAFPWLVIQGAQESPASSAWGCDQSVGDHLKRSIVLPSSQNGPLLLKCLASQGNSSDWSYLHLLHPVKRNIKNVEMLVGDLS